MEHKPDWEPTIVGFLCKWCSYAGADLAGTSRKKYPANVRIMKIPCSGRVDPLLVLKGLRLGFDGVVVSGCHPGDCHYVSGNYKARRRMVLFNSVMKSVGLDTDRVWLRWISAAEGRKFADTITEMTEHLSKKGPSAFKEKWEV